MHSVHACSEVAFYLHPDGQPIMAMSRKITFVQRQLWASEKMESNKKYHPKNAPQKFPNYDTIWQLAA